MCRCTPRKIRAIAATSWKQKDWLAPATLPAFSPLPGKQNPRTRRKRPARAITGVLLDGRSQRPSGLPHHGTHTRKCALNFEIIGTLARPQPSATIRIRNRQPTRRSHCYLYITSIELGYSLTIAGLGAIPSGLRFRDRVVDTREYFILGQIVHVGSG